MGTGIPACPLGVQAWRPVPTCLSRSTFTVPALARHHGIARSVMPPSRRQREVAARHVTSVGGGRNGEGGDLRAQRAWGDARNGRFRAENTLGEKSR